MPPLAVFFDFDGVIADTENIHVASWQRTLAAMGWGASDEVCARAVEIDDRVFLKEIFEKHKIEDGDVDGWVRRKQALTIELLTDSPRVFPGVVPLVEALKGRVRLAVVSTTWRANIEAVLAASGLASAFDTIVGKEDVAKVKPDPECYRLAVQRVGVSAAEAVALEDSPTGLAAAKAAKLGTIAIGHRHPRGEWSGDSPYVEGLARYKDVLKALELG